MKNLRLPAKIFLFISLLSGALWMGSYLARLIISYQLFEETGFNLKPFVTQENIPGIFETIGPVIILTLISYVIFIITYIIFIISAKLNLKKNGWLFITTLIIFLTFPFELYLMTIDYKMIMTINSNNFSTLQLINLITERYRVFSSFPLIELFCYFGVIYFILFQPLKMKTDLPAGRQEQQHEN